MPNFPSGKLYKLACQCWVIFVCQQWETYSLLARFFLQIRLSMISWHFNLYFFFYELSPALLPFLCGISTSFFPVFLTYLVKYYGNVISDVWSYHTKATHTYISSNCSVSCAYSFWKSSPTKFQYSFLPPPFQWAASHQGLYDLISNAKESVSILTVFEHSASFSSVNY